MGVNHRVFKFFHLGGILKIEEFEYQRQKWNLKKGGVDFEDY